MRHSARPVAAPHPRRVLALVAAVGAFLLVATFALAPPPRSDDAFAAPGTASTVGAQNLDLSGNIAAIGVTRDGYGATSGEESFIASGTNHDWAALVMLSAGWPASESNITVFTRWMRQENGPDDWWNRNNPLNNGYGSGGGAGLGSYPNLVVAAQMAAENLLQHSGYADIRAGFAASAPTAQIEQAIWASPWATSHYANGSHWAYTPVPVVKAPADAWGQ
ncbi:hypothetical protein ACFSBZ_01685 [Amnibacterium flavum]|uniref:Uncharacterized protein n=1 Tax=Amnibacterium flavum TaxID=2173173 RepID=A0A2V1HUM6_9MICO|nr:hypothetical protein [Amnibacterium flavum]PVZ94739.1 hypothetical protein DDQ50_13750 [Amnibacterium flavum]